MRRLIGRQRIAFGLMTTAAVCAAGLLLRAEPLQSVGTWMSIGPVSQGRAGAAAVSLADGRTLIAGGTGANGSATDSIVAYDPTTASFEDIGRMILPRVGHTATRLKDDRVLFTGGIVDGVVSSDIELYDPVSRTSALVALLAQPRAGHAAARLTDGTVLVVGGSTVDGVILHSAEIVDSATGSVMPALASMQQPRTGATATTLVDGRVLVAGGNNGSGDLATAELFDGHMQAFTAVDTQLSAARSGHTAVLLPHNNSVLIAGGTSGATSVSATDLFLPAEFPDPFSYGVGRFTATGSMTALRARAVGGPAGVDGYAFVTGGGSADAEVYRFATIKTDKDDYAPGERAVITGSGWRPLEEVTLLFQEDPAVHDDYVLTVTADADGNIFWDQWAPERHDLGVRFYLMGKQSDRRAQTTFTDAELLTAELTGTMNEVTVVQGGPAISQPIKISASGNISNAVTSSTPSTVRIHTTYTINTGIASSTDPSGFLNFYASGTSGASSPVTWAGASTPYSVDASFSANGATTAGIYPISLSQSSGSVVITNPNQTGAKLDDNTATTVNVRVRLATPSQFQALTVSPTRIDVSWDDVSTGEASFLIESAATAGGSFTTLATVAAGSESYSHTTGLSCGTVRYYRVQARTASGVVLNSDFSPVISGTTSSCNTAPVATAQTVATMEDVDVIGTLSGSDADGDTLTYKITSLPSNGRLFQVGADDVTPGAQIPGVPTVVANASHKVLFRPDANEHGTPYATFGFKVNDGTVDSDEANVTVNVTGVNDPPSFAMGADVTVDEDSGAFTQPGWATAISAGPADESGQSVSFVVTNNQNTLFTVQPSVSGTGVLTFTPAADAFGSATVTVQAQDNGGTADGGTDTSAAQTFTITINSVNDAPSFAKGDDVTVDEDSTAYTHAGWATDISAGPANESAQSVTLTAASDNPGLFSVQPAIGSDGTLTFTPAPDAFGVATVTVHAKDDGETANGGADTSAAQTFTITVNAVNDAPAFAKGANVAGNEDSGAYSYSWWATGISAGPANESSQTVSFVVTNDDSALFSAQPAVSSAGTLTFTPAPNAFGVATVTVYAQDNGGTANGGDDASAAQTFTITINSVNDAPGFDKGADQVVLVNSGAHTVNGWATSLSAGPANESGQALTFVIASNSNPGLFSAGPAIASNGTLTFTSAPNAAGTATIGVQLKDNGGTANGGVDTSAVQYFTISVKFAPEGTLCAGEPGHAVLSPFKPGADGLMNVVAKKGSTVPVKFKVCGADGVSIGPSPEVVAGFYFLGTTTDHESEEGTPITESTTPDTKFRWADSQWIFNLPTRQLSLRLTYWYRIDLIDGSTIYFSVTMR